MEEHNDDKEMVIEESDLKDCMILSEQQLAVVPEEEIIKNGVSIKRVISDKIKHSDYKINGTVTDR